MIGFSFLTSIFLLPWHHWQPPRGLYLGSTGELDQDCSRNEFSFNLEQCPSCNRKSNLINGLYNVTRDFQRTKNKKKHRSVVFSFKLQVGKVWPEFYSLINS